MVRELYELQQNSATDRRGNFAQSSIPNKITYGSFKDDVPNKFDKQQFLYPTSNGSQFSGSPARAGSLQAVSESPVTVLADALSTPQPSYLADEQLSPQLQYPPVVGMNPDARRRAEEERAVLEAMAQSALLPLSPFHGTTGFLDWINGPDNFRDPGNEGIQFDSSVPMGFGMQMNNEGIAEALPMEGFPSLDEIIRSMEGGGLEGGFGFLDDLNLFNTSL